MVIFSAASSADVSARILADGIAKRLELAVEALAESRQLGSGVGLSVSDEAGCVLLHQTVQRGLLGTVAFVVDRGAFTALWGCRPTACTRGARGGELGRPQAAHCVAIALFGAYQRVPACGCLPSGGQFHPAGSVSVVE